jgi:multiple sugar transport system substrate-binding protein
MPVLAVLLLVAACDDAPEETPTGGAPSGELRVGAAGSEGEIAAVEAVAEAFMDAYPGVTVVIDSVESTGDFMAKLTTEFQAGNPPDVFVLNYRRLGRFQEQGHIDPVGDVDVSGLYEGPVESFTFDGELACLPSNAASMVVFYNIGLFEEAGVMPPAAGWTWDDMMSTAQALEAAGVSAIGFSTELIRLAPFVWSNGGEIVDDQEDPTVVDLSSPEAREALQFLLDLQETGMSATDRAAQEPEEAFAAGTIGMLLDSRRSVPGFRETEGLSFDVASVPTKDGAVSVLHSDGYCVTSASENKGAAHAFAEFVVLGDGAAILAEFGRSVPVLRSVAESEAFLDPDEQPASSQVYLDQLEDARGFPHSPPWNEAEEYAEEVLTQLFAGEMTIDEAIDEIMEGTELALSKE